MGLVRLLFALLALMAFHAVARGDGPPIRGETLDKQKIDLRVKATGRRAVVLFGFSKKSQESLRSWTIRLLKESGTGEQFVVYNVASLEAAPFFIRGIIKGGMRNDVPSARHGQFVVITSHDKAWRSYLGFRTERAGDAYVLVLSPDGATLFRNWVGGPAESEEPLPDALREALGL